MKAEIGRRYAQVVRGRCHWIFTSDELPEWKDDAFIVVDVTDQPQVAEGYLHDGGASFSPPPPPTPEEIRRAEIESAITTDTALQSLRAMTNAEFNTWFDTNVTNAAQAIALLKRLTRLIIRRVL